MFERVPLIDLITASKGVGWGVSTIMIAFVYISDMKLIFKTLFHSVSFKIQTIFMYFTKIRKTKWIILR